jgi:hypothetical protein
MFKNKNLGVIKAKREVLSPELTAQLDGLYVMLADRYGQDDADSIMHPFLTARNQSRH